MNKCGMGWVSALQVGLIAFAAGAAAVAIFLIAAAYLGDGGVDPWS